MREEDDDDDGREHDEGGEDGDGDHHAHVQRRVAVQRLPAYIEGKGQFSCGGISAK